MSDDPQNVVSVGGGSLRLDSRNLALQRFGVAHRAQRSRRAQFRGQASATIWNGPLGGGEVAAAAPTDRCSGGSAVAWTREEHA